LRFRFHSLSRHLAYLARGLGSLLLLLRRDLRQVHHALIDLGHRRDHGHILDVVDRRVVVHDRGVVRDVVDDRGLLHERARRAKRGIAAPLDVDVVD